MEKISEKEYISNIIKLFSYPDKSQLMEGLEITKKSDPKSRTKYVNNFIEKYSKVQIDN